eukprot:18383-Heterococcus_DN1.PRE.2
MTSKREIAEAMMDYQSGQNGFEGASTCCAAARGTGHKLRATVSDSFTMQCPKYSEIGLPITHADRR